MSANERCADMVPTEPLSPEFERIIDRLRGLLGRLRSVREISVEISDALIGVQNTGDGFNDSVKPVPPDYFVIKCFDSLAEFDEEIERLERINEAMLKSIKVV